MNINRKQYYLGFWLGGGWVVFIAPSWLCIGKLVDRVFRRKYLVSKKICNHTCLQVQPDLIRKSVGTVGGLNSATLWSESRFGCVFRKCVLPEGLATEFPEMVNPPYALILSMVQWIHAYAHASSIADAFKHVPDLFWRPPVPGNMFGGTWPESNIICPATCSTQCRTWQPYFSDLIRHILEIIISRAWPVRDAPDWSRYLG